MLLQKCLDEFENVLERIYIIQHDYLDQSLDQAIEYHKDRESVMAHVCKRLKKHLPEPVSETLAETLTDSMDDDYFEEEDKDKDTTFNLITLKELDNDVIFTVFGHNRLIEYELLSIHGSDNDYYIIPELIHQLILYYYNYMKPVELIPICPICTNNAVEKTSDI